MYRNGSRKGMDLTFGGPPQLTSEPPTAGNGDRLLRGGILLRSARQVKSGKVTSGPSLLVDLILSASGSEGIEDLVQKKWLNNTAAFKFPSEAGAQQSTSLSLKPVPTPVSGTLPTIYFSPRIGLDLSHPGTTSATTLPLHPRIRFLPRKYRFFTHPEWLVANGRPQTFLGVLQSLIASSPAGLKTPSLGNDIARITKTKDATAAKYLADYVAGRDAGVDLLDAFIGAKGKGASSSPATYLKMMGALSNIV
jgi:hypothetical protein